MEFKIFITVAREETVGVKMNDIFRVVHSNVFLSLF